MSLPSAISAIQDLIRALSGIKDAPENPPETASAFPFAISYPRNGHLDLQSSGWGKFFHTIFSEIHVSRQILPSAVRTSLPYAELIAMAILNDPILANTVDEVAAVRYTYGKLSYGGIETIGYRFEIDVKIIMSILQGD